MKKIFVYFDNKAIIKTAQEGIDFINSIARLHCNAQIEKCMHNIFDEDGPQKRVNAFQTTGCGNTVVYVYDALGDTLEEHQKNYVASLEEAKSRIAERRQREKSAREEDLYQPRKGCYHVSICDIQIDGTFSRGNDRPIYKDFCGDVIANSGADAYNKAEEQMRDFLISEMPRNFTYFGHFMPEMTSSEYEFTFLGVVSDADYCVDKCGK